VRKECSHAAARIALVIGSAALSFSMSAPALARDVPAGQSGCRAQATGVHACAVTTRRRPGTHTHASHGSHHSTGKHHGAPKTPKTPKTPKPRHAPATHAHARAHTPRPVPAAAEASAPEPTPAAQVASVLATPCQNTEITPEATNVTLVRESVMCLINHVRAEHNEPPLKTNADLERAADEHSRELVELDYFAHVSPSGLTPVQRIRETGYIPGPEFGYVIGENLAWGTLNLSTPQSIVNAWVASPGHLANILEVQYKETGIGVVAGVPPSLGDGQAGATYAQEFGVILE
jgi:uncharacterized protein YkwD